jgi:hypothetical protein
LEGAGDTDRGRRPGFDATELVVIVDPDDCTGPAEPLREERRGHERSDLGVVEHEVQPCLRVARVERHDGGPALQDSQHGDDRSGGALEAHTDPLAGEHADVTEVVGQPVGVLVELAAGVAPPAIDDRHRRGVLGRPPFDELVQAHGLDRPARTLPV